MPVRPPLGRPEVSTPGATGRLGQPVMWGVGAGVSSGCVWLCVYAEEDIAGTWFDDVR